MAEAPQASVEDIPAQRTGETVDSGSDVLNPFPPVSVVLLHKEKHLTSTGDEGITECPAQRLPDFSFKARPAATPAEREIPGLTDTAKAKPAVVFLPDQRFTFADSSFPWSLLGKVRSAGKTGSGIVIGPRHVLTASQCINWTRDSNGKIGWVSFTPAYFDGRGPWGEFSVRQVVAWVENSTSTLTDQQTAFDYAVLVLNETINGKVGGFAGARVYDAAWNGQALWQTLGYPADLNNAERPTFQRDCVISSKQDFPSSTSGVPSGSVLGHFNDIFAGMAGGPVQGKWASDPGPSVVGVISTEPRVPQVGSTSGDNEYAGGAAMVRLINWTRQNAP
jgi:V8-like Glu-specific endopeptidase